MSVFAFTNNVTQPVAMKARQCDVKNVVCIRKHGGDADERMSRIGIINIDVLEG